MASDEKVLSCAHTAAVKRPAPLQGLEGSSTAFHEQVLDAQDRIDKKLLRMFQSAVKAEKVVRALELASQLSAVRSLEGALKLANHHRCACISSFMQNVSLFLLRASQHPG